MHIQLKKNKIILGSYKAKCAVGKRGISIKKKEGDKITPRGTFLIKYVLFRKDRVSNLKTSLRKVSIKHNMGWCNDIKSKFYNKLIKFPFLFNAEKLYLKTNIYDIVIVRKRRYYVLPDIIREKYYKKQEKEQKDDKE